MYHNVENHNSKIVMYHMFIAAQFTIARMWKQPKCPSIDEWIKKKSHKHTHTGILLSHKKE